jgi:hypothetical protein
MEKITASDVEPLTLAGVMALPGAMKGGGVAAVARLAIAAYLAEGLVGEVARESISNVLNRVDATADIVAALPASFQDHAGGTLEALGAHVIRHAGEMALIFPRHGEAYVGAETEVFAALIAAVRRGLAGSQTFEGAAALAAARPQLRVV